MGQITMPHKGLFVLALVAFFIATPVSSTEKPETRIVLRESGELIAVPADVASVPGKPVVKSESTLARAESARFQLEKNGFVESPESRSLANRYKEYAQDLLTRGKNRYVFLAEEYDFANSDAGLVDDHLLNPESESYVIVEQSALTRIYSDTLIGNIYIRESRNTEVGVVGGVAQPNLEVPGFGGHVTKVRYRDGALATLIIMAVANRRVKFIEISGQSTTEAELDEELIDFLTTLLTKVQN